MATKKSEVGGTMTVKRLTKGSIVRSVKYGAYVDILNASLKDGEMYSHADVEDILDKAYGKGKWKKESE